MIAPATEAELHIASKMRRGRAYLTNEGGEAMTQEAIAAGFIGGGLATFAAALWWGLALKQHRMASHLATFAGLLFLVACVLTWGRS